MQDPIVQSKTCLHCQSTFDITQGDLDFYSKISLTFANPSASGTSPGQGSIKFLIPTPTLCPDCRQRRRLSFRNERSLYRRVCDASGKQIISIYSPDKPYKVYDQKIRRSDSRDAMTYGKDFDFSRTFTENFRELMRVIPRLSLFAQRGENVEYTNQSYDNKNCYMSFAIGDCEDTLYSTYITQSKNCIDMTYCHYCQNSYQNINCDRCYNIQYCYFLKDCRDCISCSNCIGCSNLINCSELHNKSYCIDNIEYTKEAFFEKKQTYIIKNKWERKNLFDTNINSDSSKGMFMYNTKNSYECSDVFDIENCAYSKRIFNSHNCYDSYGMGGSQYISECIGVENLSFSITTTVVSDGSYMYYSDLCFGGNNCFGCIGLRNKSYCIFNKQYTKEEYEKTVVKIIAHMIETGERGEFFHPSLSPFGYNETVAQEYYPIQKLGEEGELGKLRLTSLTHPTSLNFGDFGYHRSHYESPKPVSDKVIPGKDLPDTIGAVEDSILDYAIACEVTGKLFRIQSQELAFYRNHGIPLPRKHPDQRHLERLALRK